MKSNRVRTSGRTTALPPHAPVVQRPPLSFALLPPRHDHLCCHLVAASLCRDARTPDGARGRSGCALRRRNLCIRRLRHEGGRAPSCERRARGCGCAAARRVQPPSVSSAEAILEAEVEALKADAAAFWLRDPAGIDRAQESASARGHGSPPRHLRLFVVLQCRAGARNSPACAGCLSTTPLLWEG